MTPKTQTVETFNWKANIWQLCISPKIKYFLWKAMRGVLPVRAALATRGLADSLLCNVLAIAPISNPPDDDLPTPSVKQILQQSKRSTMLSPMELTSTLLYPWLFWSIWLARNQLVFEGLSTSPENTLSSRLKNDNRPNKNIRWATLKSPTTFTLKPRNALSLTAGMGWLLQDDEGFTIRQGSSSRQFLSSAIAAEALAVRKVLTSFISSGFQRIQVKSDS
ncbi:unnamed protein product, partial [Thlaspi arvense]